jgi:hypothetical protein
MNAIAELAGLVPRSIFEERTPRPPVIGKIRLGTQVLSRAASQNPDAVKLYDEFLLRGESFDTIGRTITERFRIKNPLAQKNLPHFICRRSDFQNPDVADEILRIYGEDRGDGRKLWRFDALFAFDDWLHNVPNELAVWAASGRQYFSEYDVDGTRYCKMPVTPANDPHSQRVKRHFGGRTIVIRRDDAIPDGVCQPLQCPQYQGNTCNLDASFFFVIPEIKGLGLIRMPTRSIYAVINARSALQTVASARGGKIAGTRFSMEKRQVEISRIKDGIPMRQKQWIPLLDSKIDLGALLERRDAEQGALEQANRTATLLSGAASVGEPAPAHDASSSEHERDEQTDVEDLRHQGIDLLQRLGFASEQQQNQYRRFAAHEYGRGWSSAPEKMLHAIDDLRAALSCPEDFIRRVNAVESSPA